MDYEEYEAECEKIRNDNERYLATFQLDLESRGLKGKTIGTHVSNVEFYINDFLLYGDPYSAENGWGQADEFFGYFFIKKCMWSTPATIKSTAASLKKFYKCMLEHGDIKEIDYKEFCEIIRDNMECWQRDCMQYNDLDEESPFAYF